jgi:NDP-sugar pyrophosphorylase family protein
VRALILAAGEGTRLRPLTLDRPKPMLAVGEKPLIEHLIALLRAHGVTEIAINLHYRPWTIVEHLGDGTRLGVSITYSYEEQLLGSAGAAKRLEWYFDQTFLVLYGDVLTDIDLRAIVEHHRSRGAIATLALYHVPDPERCGIVELADGGRITRFVEKPPPDLGVGNLANAGVYVLEPAVLGLVPGDRPYDFGQDLFPRLLRLGLPLFGRPADGYVLDIGSPERYAQADADVRDGRFPSTSSQPHRHGVARMAQHQIDTLVDGSPV